MESGAKHLWECPVHIFQALTGVYYNMHDFGWQWIFLLVKWECSGAAGGPGSGKVPAEAVVWNLIQDILANYAKNYCIFSALCYNAPKNIRKIECHAWSVWWMGSCRRNEKRNQSYDMEFAPIATILENISYCTGIVLSRVLLQDGDVFRILWGTKRPENASVSLLYHSGIKPFVQSKR